jgi:hypothetical protein
MTTTCYRVHLLVSASISLIGDTYSKVQEVSEPLKFKHRTSVILEVLLK